MSIHVFLSHAPVDREGAKALTRHLTPMIRAKKLELWHRDGEFAEGKLAEQVEHEVQRAQICLLLVSPDLLVDCHEDIEAMEAQRKAKRTFVIPILWRSTEKRQYFFEELRGLPRDGRPIAERRDKDVAWVEVVKGLRAVMDKVEQPQSGNIRVLSASRSLDNAAAEVPIASSERIVTGSGNTVVIGQAPSETLTSAEKLWQVKRQMVAVK